MKNFIKVTDTDGVERLINVSFIQSVFPDGEGSGLKFAKDDYLYVKEPFNNLCALLTEKLKLQEENSAIRKKGQKVGRG